MPETEFEEKRKTFVMLIGAEDEADEEDLIDEEV